MDQLEKIIDLNTFNKLWSWNIKS